MRKKSDIPKGGKFWEHQYGRCDRKGLTAVNNKEYLPHRHGHHILSYSIILFCHLSWHLILGDSVTAVEFWSIVTQVYIQEFPAS